MDYLYLFTLEVDPLTVCNTYNPLPMHLTLVSRFWSELPPDAIASATLAVFEHTKPIQLVFGEEATIGPKKTPVNLVQDTEAMKNLHLQLVELLNSLGVSYTLPQFVGEGHLPHVSKRADSRFVVGSRIAVDTAYLIEVDIRGKDHSRYVRMKFDLAG